MAEDLETWQNATKATIVIKKHNLRGELADEVIGPERVVHLAPGDRRINQELAANEDLDVFHNGLLTPVRLIETEEDAKELASNPNAMSEGDMEELFKVHHKTFETKVAGIRNEGTLRRLLEVAKKVDARTTQVEKIQARIAEVSPQTYTEIEHAGSGAAPGLRPVTPR